MLAPIKKTPKHRTVKTGIRGIYLTDKGPSHVGDRWQVKVRDDKKRKRDGGDPRWVESYATKEQAMEEAIAMQAKLRTKLAQSGGVDAEEAMEEYLEAKRGEDHGKRYMKRIVYVLGRVLKEAKITDLLDDKVVTRAQRWLNELRLKNRKMPIGVPAPFVAIGTRIQYGNDILSWGLFLVERGRCVATPFKGLRLPDPDPEAAQEPFTVAEAKLLCSDKAIASMEGKAVAALILGGFRRTEFAWLRREHVLAKHHLIRVEEPDEVDEKEAVTVHKIREERHGGPIAERHEKTLKNGPRHARLERDLAPILALLPTDYRNGYLFPDDFRIMSDDSWTPMLQRQCDLMGIDRRDRTCRSLRNTNICLLDVARVGPATLMEHIGHGDLKVTRQYSRHITLMKLEDDAAGWGDGHIHLRSNPEGGAPTPTPPPTPKPEDGAPTQAPSAAPHILHAAPTCKPHAKNTALEGSTSVGVGEGDDSLPIVITDDTEPVSATFAVSSSPEKGSTTSARVPCCDPVVSIGWGYDYTRRNHTECLVQGDVMTFRMTGIPLPVGR